MLMQPNRQKGIGLVEIMVALVVSSLLVAGVVQIFISNRQAYQLQSELASPKTFVWQVIWGVAATWK
jgi:Tfp pilus assembly protein PilW